MESEFQLVRAEASEDVDKFYEQVLLLSQVIGKVLTSGNKVIRPDWSPILMIIVALKGGLCCSN